MKLATALHGRLVLQRRLRRLVAHIHPLLPAKGELLDIGAGDGRLSAALLEHHAGMVARGLDVLIRPDAAIPVSQFDGQSIPFGDAEIDYALLIDVLHHAEAPERLLREALRVSRAGVILKDHLSENRLDAGVLRAMDWVGNAGHGVRLPYSYLARHEWDSLFRRVGAKVTSWQTDLGLYPFPANLLFDRQLHFLAVLRLDRSPGIAPSTT